MTSLRISASSTPVTRLSIRCSILRRAQSAAMPGSSLGHAADGLPPRQARGLAEGRRQQRPVGELRGSSPRARAARRRTRPGSRADRARRPRGQSTTHVAQGDALELREQRRHLLADVAGVADVRVRAAAELRRLAHEIGVRRGADADREQACVAEALLDRREQRRFGADGAVRQKDDLPQIARSHRLRERHLDRGTDVGAAVGDQAVDEAQSLRVGRRCVKFCGAA